jgi:oligoribonuclease
MSESKREVLVVLDLETTGLDPEKDPLLEIAFICVDNVTLEELGRFQSVVIPPSLDMLRIHPVVRDMHTTNGLFAEIFAAEDDMYVLLNKKPTAERVEKEALDVLDSLTENCKRILTGNSIHFDKSYLARHMPRLERKFHYGICDVSSARRVLGTKRPTAKEDVAHRAMADCEMSLAELKALRTAFQEKTNAP